MAELTKEHRQWMDDFLKRKRSDDLRLQNDDDPTGPVSGSSSGTTTAQPAPAPTGGSGQPTPPSTKSLFDQLMDAIEADDLAQVQLLLPQIKAKKIDLNGKRNGDTPLTLAAKSTKDDDGIVHELVVSSADVNKKGDGGKTPLYVSVETFRDHSKRKVFDYLLAKAKPDEADDEGKTPLYVACGVDLSIVTDLVAKGAKVNAKTKTGETLLMHASEYAKDDIMTFLLSKGAKVDETPTADKKTALMYLAGNKTGSFNNKQALAVLLGGNADLNKTDTDDQTALMLAAKAKNSEIIAELAKQSNIDVNQKSKKDSATALILAAQSQSLSAVKPILATGKVADIDQQAKNGRTALMEASDDSDGIAFDAANAIFSFTSKANPTGPNLDLQDNSGNTALMLAASHGNGRLVELLAPKTTAKIADALKLAELARAKAVKEGMAGMSLRPFDRAVTALGGKIPKTP